MLTPELEHPAAEIQEEGLGGCGCVNTLGGGGIQQHTTTLTFVSSVLLVICPPPPPLPLQMSPRAPSGKLVFYKRQRYVFGWK